MKKLTAIVLAVLVLGSAFLARPQWHEARVLSSVALDNEYQVCVKTSDGNIWRYFDSEYQERGKTIEVKIFNNAIRDVKYE
jgi:hypothetical protein